MLVAVPMDSSLSIYHDNPSTAPQFALFSIEGDRTNLVFALRKMVQNPWKRAGCDAHLDENVKQCNCSKERADDMHHLAEHYVVLEAIRGCTYLLADKFCRNMVRALHNGGVKVYKIPPFIHNGDKAIKHFLIGENYADTVQHIHHAS